MSYDFDCLFCRLTSAFEFEPTRRHAHLDLAGHQESNHRQFVSFTRWDDDQNDDLDDDHHHDNHKSHAIRTNQSDNKSRSIHLVYLAKFNDNKLGAN